MDTKHHCNSCPHWYVTQKQYPSGFYDITICRKYGKQIYYLAGDENRTPYPCSICEKEFSYVPYMEQELLQEVEQVTERLTEAWYDGMEQFDRYAPKSPNIEINCGGDDFQNIIDKLAEYETAEEDGRLVVLPCDTVYFICDKGTKDAHVRTKSILDLLVYDINGIDKDGRYWSVKEEAEKALKEMKKNERILY